MRSVLLYAVLLSGSLVATYLTMTAEEVEERKPGETEVYRAKKGDVKTLTYVSGSSEIVLKKTSDERGEFLRVHIQDEVAVPAEPSLEEPTATDPPPTPTTRKRERDFTGNQNAMRLFSSYEPLIALRKLDTSALTDNLGFDDPLGVLTIERPAGPITVTLGGKSYGAKHVYGKVGDDIYLLRESSLKPLMGDPRRLMERTLQPLLNAQVTQTTLQQPEHSPIDLIHVNRADPRAAHYTLNGERSDAAATFMKNFLQVSAESTPPKDLPEPGANLLDVTVTGDDGAWHLTFKEGDAKWSAVSSDHLRDTVWIKASELATLLDDLTTLR